MHQCSLYGAQLRSTARQLAQCYLVLAHLQHSKFTTVDIYIYISHSPFNVGNASLFVKRSQKQTFAQCRIFLEGTPPCIMSKKLGRIFRVVQRFTAHYTMQFMMLEQAFEIIEESYYDLCVMICLTLFATRFASSFALRFRSSRLFPLLRPSVSYCIPQPWLVHDSGAASPKIFGGQNVWLLANSNVFVWDAASQSTKYLEMLKFYRDMTPCPPLATPMVHDRLVQWIMMLNVAKSLIFDPNLKHVIDFWYALRIAVFELWR